MHMVFKLHQRRKSYKQVKALKAKPLKLFKELDQKQKNNISTISLNKSPENTNFKPNQAVDCRTDLIRNKTKPRHHVNSPIHRSRETVHISDKVFQEI